MCLQENKGKMKILVAMLVYITWVKGSPFPNNMYHTRDPDGIQSELGLHGYQVRSITKPQIIRKSLAQLDPWGCDDERQTNIHELPDFGKVAVQGRTYTQMYHKGGRYYPTAEAYDKACTCPLLYAARWLPHWGRQRIESNELRHDKHALVETTEISVRERDYYIFFDETVTRWQHVTNGANARIKFLNLTEKGTKNPIFQNQHSNFQGNFALAKTQLTMAYLALTQRIRGQKLTQRIRDIVARKVMGEHLSRMFASKGALLVRKEDIITGLKMVDYVINSMYEKYHWVEWELVGQKGDDVPVSWKNINRSEICQIAEEQNWGIEYEIGTPRTRRVCDVGEYSLTKNVTSNGFTWILPLGGFEPYNLSSDHRYLLRKLNKTVDWTYRSPGLENWFVKVIFRHGPTREKRTKIWAIMQSESTYTKFHKTMLTPIYWKHRNTIIVKEEGDLMCERDAYYIEQRRMNLGERAWLPAERYQAFRVLEHRHPEKCEQIYTRENQCRKNTQLMWCKEATGPLEVVLQRRSVIPDIHNNQSVLAYGTPCFMHTNYTLNATGQLRTKRFFLSLLFSAMFFGIEEAAFSAKLEKYQALMNQKLGALTQKMNDGFNRIEGQLDGIHRGQLQMQHELTVLAQYTASLAHHENEFEKAQIEVDRQLIEGQIALSRTTIENRQLALAAGKASAQEAIINYNLHKRILRLMDHLEQVPGLKNNTIYRNTLRKGLIECKELYWYGKNLSEFASRYENTENIQRVEQLVSNAPILRQELYELEIRAQQTIPWQIEVENIVNATLPAFERINFTFHWDPVTLDFNNLSWGNGAREVLGQVLGFGGKVVDDVAGVFNNVVDKGADVIEHTEDTVSGFFSGPIKMIIIIVGTIIGIILVMVFGSCAMRYYKTGKSPNVDKALKLATTIGNLNPVNVAGALASQSITSTV